MPTGTVDLDRRANWRDFASTINGQTATQVRSLDETAGGGGRANEYERIDMTRGSQHSIQQLTYDEAGNLVATDLLADMNCDGAVNSFDVDPFTQALTNPAAYAAAHPDCMIELGDVNGDGLVNLFDVNAFIDLLGDNLMSARRYEYDEENRLTAVTDVCGRELLTIEYDALGRRIASTEYAIPMDACPGESGPIVAQTRHIYSGLNTMAEYVWSDSQWSKAREFLWGERFPEPLVLIDFTDAGELEAGTPEVLHYVHDALGSVVGLVDAGDPAATPDPIPPKLVERYDYDPYGKTYIETWDAATESWVSTSGSSFGNPFAWTGQRYDAGVGMYHFVFRSHSPELGRWMQRDPLGYVDGVNLYSYVGSAPLCYMDPLGLIGVFIKGFSGSSGGTGMDEMANDPEIKGLVPGGEVVKGHTQAGSAVDEIVKAKQANPDEPVIIVGHSFGGDTAVEVAQDLEKKGIKVDLLIQIDSVGVGDEKKPDNVTVGVNIHTAGDGDGLDGAENVGGSENIPLDGTSHTDIDNDPRTTAIVTKKVAQVCGTGAQGEQK